MTACGHGIPGAMLRKIWGMVVITDRFDRFLWPRTTFDCGRSCRGTPPSLKACGEVPAQQGTLTLRHISGAPIQNYRRLGKSAAPRCCGLASRRAQRTRVFQILLVRLVPIGACTPPPHHYWPPPVASYMWRLRRPACTNKRKHRWGYLHGRLRALRCHLLQPRVVTSVGGCAAQDTVLQTAR